MGGDGGPAVVVEGALVAARHQQIALLLVGAAERIESELSRHRAARGLDIQIVDAPERIEMDEDAAASLRRKPGASIRIAADAVRDHVAAALFSAGHTGATVLAAHAAFGMLPGVDRPALATIIPTRHGGVPLVGLNGLAIVGHGKSSPKAIANAVTMAARAVREDLLGRLAHDLDRIHLS